MCAANTRSASRWENGSDKVFYENQCVFAVLHLFLHTTDCITWHFVGLYLKMCAVLLELQKLCRFLSSWLYSSDEWVPNPVIVGLYSGSFWCWFKVEDEHDGSFRYPTALKLNESTFIALNNNNKKIYVMKNQSGKVIGFAKHHQCKGISGMSVFYPESNDMVKMFLVLQYMSKLALTWRLCLVG